MLASPTQPMRILLFPGPAVTGRAYLLSMYGVLKWGWQIFHVEGIPRFHHIELRTGEDGMVDMGFKAVPEDSYGQLPEVLTNDTSFTTWKSAVCAHHNDFFRAGRRFGQFLDGALKKRRP